MVSQPRLNDFFHLLHFSFLQPSILHHERHLCHVVFCCCCLIHDAAFLAWLSCFGKTSLLFGHGYWFARPAHIVFFGHGCGFTHPTHVALLGRGCEYPFTTLLGSFYATLASCVPFWCVLIPTPQQFSTPVRGSP